MDLRNIITTLLRDGFILVFNQNKLDIVKTAEALISAGVNNMEVTCRIKKPLEKLARLRKEIPEFVAGAASLIDWSGMLDVYNKANPQNTLPTLQQTVDAGACYLVSPVNFSDESFERFAGRIPMIPGCGTATEIVSQFSKGANLCKVFPAKELGGPAFIRAIDPAIHKTISLVPTGGTNTSNIPDYIDSGVLVLGGSFSMIENTTINKIINEQVHPRPSEAYGGRRRASEVQPSQPAYPKCSSGRASSLRSRHYGGEGSILRSSVLRRTPKDETTKDELRRRRPYGEWKAAQKRHCSTLNVQRPTFIMHLCTCVFLLGSGCASAVLDSSTFNVQKVGRASVVRSIDFRGSRREFYHLVQAGVPFPTVISYFVIRISYFEQRKTNNASRGSRRAFERATSAGREGRWTMDDRRETVGHLLTVGSGQSGRIAGVVTIDKKAIDESNYAINVFLGANIVLAAGGPGELYKTSVYPKGQASIHGLAFKAGLVGENLTESQFGLASIKFRWNVSGTYMQAIPRIFSTDFKGKDEREFLTNFFPSMGKLATNIFLKGYQWPFDPQRIKGGQSSLIDILVFNETQKGRHVFLDFLHNPTAPDRNIRGDSMEDFDISALEPEAYDYLKKAGALQGTPIERLTCMNPPAIEIYKENGIDLYSEPLEIALCAQHNNGGFTVDKWWQSNIPRTFIIGEMAATHGVKRPGGAALNAGQVGGLRAAEYIVNFYGCPPQSIPPQLLAKQERGDNQAEIEQQLSQFVARLESYKSSAGLIPEQVIEEIQNRMTASAGHIRELNNASESLEKAVKLYKDIQEHGFKLEDAKGIIAAIRAEHLALTSVAYLKAIVELLKQGSGSRGSHLVLSEDGAQIHPDIINGATGRVLRFKPENKELRDSVLQVEYDQTVPDLFRCRTIQVRPMPAERKAFEPCWRDYREGKIYS